MSSVLAFVRTRWLTTVVALFALVATPAFALSPEFGVSVTPASGNGPAFGASVGLPVLTLDETDPIELVARLDVASTFRFETLPSVGLTALARGTNQGFETYLGTGVALGWIDEGEADSSFVAWTVMTGARYPVTESLFVRAELAVAPIAQGMGLSLGLDWAPWRE